MKTTLKLAWRNLWRNKRRTAITVSSIFFGVFFSVFMTSVQQGSMDNMIENMVRFYSGYVQIQDSSYRDNRSINNTFLYSKSLDSLIRADKRISTSTQRIESFALASSGEKSAGAAIFGVLPGPEDGISQISKWVASGRYLESGDKGVMLGINLANNLGLELNDTLVLLGQGYHGVTAAGKYPITGLLDFPLEEMNNNIVYMELENCRELFSVPGRSSAVVIMLHNPKAADDVTASLGNKIDSGLKAYPWHELLEEIENLVSGKLASGKIIKGILFMVIGFGIWGTIIMLMAERKREFGIMIALGVKKTKLVYILLFESILIGILGILAGIAGSLPLVTYFFINPIYVTGKVAETYSTMGFEPVIKFSVQPEIFMMPSLTVLVLFAIIFLYPIWHLKKLKTADALRA
jgi:ABC-type lipoprotein release transport system permease subunit